MSIRLCLLFSCFSVGLSHKNAQDPSRSLLKMPFVSLAYSDYDAPGIYREDLPKTTIKTSLGDIRGFTYQTPGGNPALVFQGIPYAEPPTGKNRFVHAIAKKPWTGVIDAFKYGAACTQVREVLKMPGEISEDCLNLNIFAPSDSATVKESYPVIYYVFGGDFDFGSPRTFEPSYIIDNFVRQGIIFVTVNFRLGVFGFWSTGTKEAPGNMQMSDQIMGLQWINQEIGHFGGDASRLTLMGHSSGGVNVGHLTLTPWTEGLYQQAIVMSGPMLAPNFLADSDMSRYQKTAQEVGCSGWDTNEIQKLLSCMNNVVPVKLANAYLIKASGTSSPRVDGPGGILPEPLEILATKRRGTAYLVGTASYEAPMGPRSGPQPDTATITAHCKLMASISNTTNLIPACVHFYDVYNRGKPTTYWDQPLKLLDSDYIFFAPTFKDADYMRKAGGGAVYLYNFVYPNEGQEEIAVEHAMDLALILGFPTTFLPLSERDKRMGTMYSEMFGNFVKYGNPTPAKPTNPAVGVWEPLTSPTGFNHYRFNFTSKMEEFYHFDAVQFWNEVAPYLN